MLDREQQFMAAVGLQKLNSTWAKLEILVGLGVVWVAIHRPEQMTSGFLFVLGGYLAMAGSRSHLYQSSNRTMAFLWETIRNGAPRS